MRELGAALALCGLAACGGASGAEVRVEDFEDELERSFCEFYIRCGIVPDMDACVATSAAPISVNMMATLRSGVEAGTIEYHADDAAACIALLDGQACTRSYADELFRTDALEEVCAAVFTGTVEDGGACSIAEQCVSGRCALAGPCTEACCSGACEPATPPPEPVPIGADCSAGICVDGAYCRQDAGPLTCQPLVGEGGPCDATAACQLGLFCVSDGVTAPTCRTAAAEGESCEVTLCDELDDYCDPMTVVCTQLPAPGESCGQSGCVGYADCIDGTCLAAGLAGAACGGTAPSCLGELDCDTGVCVLPTLPPPCILE